MSHMCTHTAVLDLQLTVRTKFSTHTLDFLKLGLQLYFRTCVYTAVLNLVLNLVQLWLNVPIQLCCTAVQLYLPTKFSKAMPKATTVPVLEYHSTFELEYSSS